MKRLKKEIEDFKKNTEKVDNYEYEVKVRNLIKSIENYIQRKEGKENDNNTE